MEIKTTGYEVRPLNRKFGNTGEGVSHICTFPSHQFESISFGTRRGRYRFPSRGWLPPSEAHFRISYQKLCAVAVNEATSAVHVSSIRFVGVGTAWGLELRGQWLINEINSPSVSSEMWEFWRSVAVHERRVVEGTLEKQVLASPFRVANELDLMCGKA